MARICVVEAFDTILAVAGIQKFDECWHCHAKIAYFVRSNREMIEHRGALPLSPAFWSHIDEAEPYHFCKVNGYHPGPGAAFHSASPQVARTRLIIGISIPAVLILMFLVAAYSGIFSK